MNKAIDGLRSLAVVAVMLYHCGAPASEAGWLGVDLFFVLSGFLITTLLLRERDKHGEISLRMFWARRFLRLMPIYVLYVTAVTVVLLTGAYGRVLSDTTWSLGAFIATLWTYTHNFVPQGGIWSEQQLTRHLWSLAVEEQFYFLWPVLVAAVGVWRRLAWLVAVAVALMLLSNVFYYGGRPPHLQLQARGVSIFVGCLMAITLHGRAEWFDRTGLVSSAAAWGSAAVAVLAYAVMTGLERFQHLGEARILATGVPVFAASSALLIANLWRQPDSSLARLLSRSPLPQIGAISYGIYLYHMVVLEVVWKGLLPGIEHWNKYPKFGLRVLTFFALTFLLAQLSYRYIEKPCLRLKERFRPAAPPPAPADTA